MVAVIIGSFLVMRARRLSRRRRRRRHHRHCAVYSRIATRFAISLCTNSLILGCRRNVTKNYGNALLLPTEREAQRVSFCSLLTSRSAERKIENLLERRKVANQQKCDCNENLIFNSYKL